MSDRKLTLTLGPLSLTIPAGGEGSRVLKIDFTRATYKSAKFGPSGAGQLEGQRGRGQLILEASVLLEEADQDLLNAIHNYSSDLADDQLNPSITVQNQIRTWRELTPRTRAIVPDTSIITNSDSTITYFPLLKGILVALSSEPVGRYYTTNFTLSETEVVAP